MRAVRVLAVLCLCLPVAVVVSGCSSNSANEKKQEEVSVEELYNRAAAAMDDGKYRQASKLFDDVERQHPYSPWAKQAQLMAAYAHYLSQRYDDAIIALDRFIELHPGSDKVDYAYYLKALSYYEQISDVRRDQDMTEEALKALDTITRLYPDSPYARDSALKKDLAQDHLAGKEMEIGRYYINRGHVNAAINRFMVVVKDYQTTTHVAEALHRLVECYLTLGLKDEATRVAAVLGYNYPGSVWYKRSYDLLDDQSRAEILENRGFVDRTIDSIFKPE